MHYDELEAVFWSILAGHTHTTPAPRSVYWHAFQHVAMLPLDCQQETLIFEITPIPTAETSEAPQAFLFSLKRHMFFPFDDDSTTVFPVAFECMFRYQPDIVLNSLASWLQVWVEDNLSVAAQAFFAQVEQQSAWQQTAERPIIGVTTFVG